MAESGELTGESVGEAGEEVPQHWRRRNSGCFSGGAAFRRLWRAQGLDGVFCAKGGERASGAGRKKDLPRSPIYRGGVVTRAVTTPPGSTAPLGFCGLAVATQRRVYT